MQKFNNVNKKLFQIINYAGFRLGNYFLVMFMSISMAVIGCTKSDPQPIIEEKEEVVEEPVEVTPEPLVNGYLTQAELDMMEANRSDLDPYQWSSWPQVPELNPYLKLVHERGLANGYMDNRYSALGDCQSMPGVFLGMYETLDEVVVATSDLAADLEDLGVGLSVVGE